MNRLIMCAGALSASLLFASALSACGDEAVASGSTQTQSAGITVSGSANGHGIGGGIIFVYLPGHVRCPEMDSYDHGHAFDGHGHQIGMAQEAGMQSGDVANGGGGGNDISKDVFFNNVPLGDFTICARPADDRGRCDSSCNTARAFGRTQEAHKTHVTLVMTCKTPNTQDVGAVVEVQHAPSIDLTGAVETGLVACGRSSSAAVLTASGNIVSPDGTAAEYLVAFDGPAPAGVVLSPTAWTWASHGAFSITAKNLSGGPADAPVKIRARILGLDGNYMYADDYTLTFSWLECR